MNHNSNIDALHPPLRQTYVTPPCLSHGSLFSGIGGFDLAAQWMGWKNIFHCEWNPFGQKILKYYWPNAISYDDITKTDFTIHRGRIDVLTGGFPCQPYSVAGKRKGKDDERHLWPEMLRAIREIQPTYVVGENVFGLINWNGGMVFNEVQADLEAEGYEVWPYVLPACGVNAPHRRDRVWFVAYAGGIGHRRRGVESGSDNDEKRKVYQDEQNDRCSVWSENEGCGAAATNTHNDGQTGSKNRQGNSKGNNRSEARTDDAFQSERRSSEAILSTPHPNSFQRLEGRLYQAGPEEAERHLSAFRSRNDWRAWEDFPTQSPVCGGDDGLPTELDGITFSKWRTESIKAFGNAIVPQVAYQIFKAIQEYEVMLSEA